jgi:riboflavin kinase/FMN adenylyltransferase
VPGTERKLIPNRGVYLTRVHVRGEVSFGMCNVGVRPTFDNGELETIEVNLFDWPLENGDFYDEQVMIEFLQKLREERKFENIDELTMQLANDKKTCLATIENYREI